MIYFLKCTKEQMEGMMDNGHHYLVGSEDLPFIRLYPFKKCVLIARHNDIMTSKILNNLVTNVEDITLVETTCNCGSSGSCKCMLTSSCFSYAKRNTSISNNFTTQFSKPHCTESKYLVCFLTSLIEKMNAML